MQAKLCGPHGPSARVRGTLAGGGIRRIRASWASWRIWKFCAMID